MTFKPQLTIPQWLQLNQEERRRFKEVFSIPRSGGTEVLNNEVICDGHLHPDLAHVTVEKMQAYTGLVSTDFFELLNASKHKVQEELQAPLKAQLAAAEAERAQAERERDEAMEETVTQLKKVAEKIFTPAKTSKRKTT